MKRTLKNPTDEQSALAVLQEQLAACPRDGGGRRVYSDELAHRVGRYALSRREGDVGLKALASELGVWESQVARWLKRLKGSGFREVALVAGHERGAEVRPEVVRAVGVRESELVVMSPRGFRIEGLSVTELSELLGGM